MGQVNGSMNRKVFSVIRVDRVTGDAFPVLNKISLGAAKLMADRETVKRLPRGDIFAVVNEDGKPTYAPDFG